MSAQASRRRRAAYAVLAPVLDEDAVVEALQLQHQSMRGEGVTDIIAYVDAVAARHMLDAATRKRLYGELYEALKQPEHLLPLDPLPMMQMQGPEVQRMQAMATRPTPSMASAAPLSRPVVLPQPEPAPRLPEPPAPPAEAVTPPAQPSPAGTPAQQVFAALMRHAISHLRQQHGGAANEVRSGLVDGLDGLRLNESVREQVQKAWPSDHGDGPWWVEAQDRTLAELVNLFYVALCEALGPVEADHVLTRAVQAAETEPAARSFSPRRLV